MPSFMKTTVQKQLLVARHLYYEAVVAMVANYGPISAVGYKTVDAQLPWELWLMSCMISKIRNR